METNALNANAIPLPQDIAAQGFAASVDSPTESFESVLSKFGQKTNPNIISGGEEFQDVDFQQMRLELAEKIKQEMKNGDPEGRLALLQQEFDRVNTEARRVANRDFDSSMARLSTPSQDLANIKMGRFARDSHAASATTAKTTPENCPILPDTKDANANCIQIPGMKTAVPPQVDVDLATPERNLPPTPNDQAPVPNADPNLHGNNAPKLRPASAAPQVPFETQQTSLPSATRGAEFGGPQTTAAEPESSAPVSPTSSVSSAATSSASSTSTTTASAGASSSGPTVPSSSSGAGTASSGGGTSVGSGATGSAGPTAPTAGTPASGGSTMAGGTLPSSGSTGPAAAGTPASGGSTIIGSGSSGSGGSTGSLPGTPASGGGTMAGGPLPGSGSTGSGTVTGGGTTTTPVPGGLPGLPGRLPEPIRRPPGRPGGGTSPIHFPISSLPFPAGGGPVPVSGPPSTMPPISVPTASPLPTTTGPAPGTPSSSPGTMAVPTATPSGFPVPKSPLILPISPAPAVKPHAYFDPQSPANGVTRSVASAGSIENEQLFNNPFGVADSIYKAVTQNERIGSALKSLPEKAVALYKEASPEEKLEMAKRINEKTQVFFFTIDNREAFITGKAMGRDTFDYLLGSLDNKWKEGKVTDYEKMRQETALNILKTLSSDQREGYVSLLEAETKPVAVN